MGKSGSLAEVGYVVWVGWVGVGWVGVGWV
jgi:hypothetical protein